MRSAESTARGPLPRLGGASSTPLRYRPMPSRGEPVLAWTSAEIESGDQGTVEASGETRPETMEALRALGYVE